MFASFDTDRSGTLEAEELARMVTELVPGVKPSEIMAIMAIIDSNEDRSVTQDEFMEATRMWVAAARRLAAERRLQAGADALQAGAAAGSTAAMMETSEVKVRVRACVERGGYRHFKSQKSSWGLACVLGSDARARPWVWAAGR